MRNRIITFTIITLTAAYFFLCLTKSSNIEENSVHTNETNSQVKVIVDASNAADAQFIYGSKKKLISDF